MNMKFVAAFFGQGEIYEQKQQDRAENPPTADII